MAKAIHLIRLLHHVFMQNTTAEGGGESPSGGGSVGLDFSTATNSMYAGVI